MNSFKALLALNSGQCYYATCKDKGYEMPLVLRPGSIIKIWPLHLLSEALDMYDRPCARFEIVYHKHRHYINDGYIWPIPMELLTGEYFNFSPTMPQQACQTPLDRSINFLSRIFHKLIP